MDKLISQFVAPINKQLKAVELKSISDECSYPIELLPELLTLMGYQVLNHIDEMNFQLCLGEMVADVHVTSAGVYFTPVNFKHDIGDDKLLFLSHNQVASLIEST